MQHDREPLRPGDFARLLLASDDLRPRKRARDQQADLAGLELKKRILEHVARLDPEPEEIEAALLRIVEEMGAPFGPARAVALTVHEEWRTACTCTEWVELLLQSAVAASETNDRQPRKERQGRADVP